MLRRFYAIACGISVVLGLAGGVAWVYSHHRNVTTALYLPSGVWELSSRRGVITVHNWPEVELEQWRSRFEASRLAREELAERAGARIPRRRGRQPARVAGSRSTAGGATATHAA